MTQPVFTPTSPVASTAVPARPGTPRGAPMPPAAVPPPPPSASPPPPPPPAPRPLRLHRRRRPRRPPPPRRSPHPRPARLPPARPAAAGPTGWKGAPPPPPASEAAAAPADAPAARPRSGRRRPAQSVEGQATPRLALGRLPGRPSAQAEALHLVAERGPRDAEGARGAPAAAVVSPQRPPEDLALDLVERAAARSGSRRPATARFAGGGAAGAGWSSSSASRNEGSGRQLERVDVDAAVSPLPAQDRRAPDGVAQLAHVAGKGRGRQRRQRRRVQPRDRPPRPRSREGSAPPAAGCRRDARAAAAARRQKPASR